MLQEFFRLDSFVFLWFHAIDDLNVMKTELDQLLENAPLPFIVQHASRISSVKQRVSSLNLVLKSIQRRIDNIDHMLSANITLGKLIN